MGIIPAEAAEAIVAAAQGDYLRTEVLAASARNVGYPVVGLVAELSRAAGEAGGWTHWGATTQDIMDTATVLQVREGLGLIEAECARFCGPWRIRRSAPGHGDGRPHASATGPADHVRPEMRHLGVAVHWPSSSA